ncbi:hypothetical protein A6M23_12915 [Acidithiobacillus thiooxidans]|uniref:Uncharacterized protein n=1 Tax=Acidithiobacillus thiooxidans TaxID=930 RepID=A0A1C2J486_ACITH|nr:hypothetical protein A6M23_12915 [Acidithiobacillus thiooxidans]OCX83071.1 hypothetical protein A6P08_11175 [Acidithiobacillus thiooxidans]
MTEQDVVVQTVSGTSVASDRAVHLSVDCQSMIIPVRKAINTPEPATTNAICQPRNIHRATNPYQLNQGVAIKKAQAGPGRLPPRQSASAVGIAVQQHKGVKNPTVAPIALAGHKEYPDKYLATTVGLATACKKPANKNPKTATSPNSLE